VSNTLLGGLSGEEFLRRHWQSRPLLVRGALAHFAGFVDLDLLLELATREDCESRLVLRAGRHWRVEHGPLSRRRLHALPPLGWTLLVQGVDRFVPQARELLRRFDFVPRTRLDDLMVSFAPPGGGVGPHFDSYDVFLLQGSGRRRWQVSHQTDLALIDGEPLKILERFRPQGECILTPGDMLYLPPGWAHDGVAIDSCFTYSIGFRAPSRRELLSGFLAYLDETVPDDGLYSDRGLVRPRHPGAIDRRLVEYTAKALGAIRWGPADVIEFLGRHLTTPKPQVTFAEAAPLPLSAFARRARQRGLTLAGGARLAYHGSRAYINGESLAMRGRLKRAIVRLADEQRLRGAELPPGHGALRVLYRWYRNGYIEFA
jgi:50S ribosomal protein L16 3-hydroxylase